MPRPASKKYLKRLLAARQNVLDEFLKGDCITRKSTPDDVLAGYAENDNPMREPHEEAARAAFRAWMIRLNGEIARVKRELATQP